MANPQKEKGYIAIANEIAEVLARTDLSGHQWRILWVVWRKTWGWNKKSDGISLSQLQQLCNMKNRKSVVRNVNLLIERGILLTVKHDYKPTVYQFNKDYDTWRSSVQNDTIESSVAEDTRVVSIMPPRGSVQNDTYNNHNKPLNKTMVPAENSPVRKTEGGMDEVMRRLLTDAFEAVNPSFLNFYRNKTERQALVDVVNAIGFQETMKAIELLPKLIGMPYAPIISTPYQLSNKLAALADFIKKHPELIGGKKKVEKLKGREFV